MIRDPIGSSGHEYLLKSNVEIKYRASKISSAMLPFGNIIIGLINSDPFSALFPIIQDLHI